MANFKNILLYGTVLGLLLVVLNYFQYRLVLMLNAVEWYVGIIALVFTALGIWAGRKLADRSSPKTDLPATDSVKTEAPSCLDTGAVLAKHNITPREYEVLHLMAQGLSNQEIADRLFVSLHTVKTHASNLLAKLDAQRRTQAIQKAKSLGLPL